MSHKPIPLIDQMKMIAVIHQTQMNPAEEFEQRLVMAAISDEEIEHFLDFIRQNVGLTEPTIDKVRARMKQLRNEANTQN